MEEFLTKYINGYYLIVFMAATYSFKNKFHTLLEWIFRHKLNKHFSVFVIGFIAAIPFWTYFHHDKLMLVTTYAIGTTLHDLIISYCIRKAKEWMPKKKGQFPVEPQHLRE